MTKELKSLLNHLENQLILWQEAHIRSRNSDNNDTYMIDRAVMYGRICELEELIRHIRNQMWM